ncbi:MAG: hypothetical protein QW630_01865 [Sulfolobales archaeon]
MRCLHVLGIAPGSVMVSLPMKSVAYAELLYPSGSNVSEILRSILEYGVGRVH